MQGLIQTQITIELSETYLLELGSCKQISP